jgi:hypothetical protein
MSAEEYHPTAPTTFPNQFYDHYNFMDHKQVKRQQEFCKKEYNLLFKSAKRSMKKNHFASIPDQADIESSFYLKSQKDKFLKDYLDMKEEWDAQTKLWTEKFGNPGNAYTCFQVFTKKWRAKGMIIVCLVNVDTTKEYLENHPSWDDFDFRVMKDIWVHGWSDSKKSALKGTGDNRKPLFEHMKPVFKALQHNLARVISQQKLNPGESLDSIYFPVPTQITLMAGGTVLQKMHTDFLTYPDSGVPLDRWYGSSLYLFKDYNTPLEKMSVLQREVPGVEIKKKDRVKLLTTQQGFITFFSGNLKHAGGIHSVPNVRLYCYFDSPDEQWKRKKDSVLIMTDEEDVPEGTLLTRIFRAKKASFGLHATSNVYTFKNLYKKEHPPLITNGAEGTDEEGNHNNKEDDKEPEDVPPAAAVTGLGDEAAENMMDSQIDAVIDEGEHTDEGNFEEEEEDSKMPALKHPRLG